jgi:hypothetical protein
MANRHHHKKLRVEIHARMARTGESYQKARDAILAPPEPSSPVVELMSITSFGVPVTLAMFEGEDFSSFSLLGGQAPSQAPIAVSRFTLPWRHADSPGSADRKSS